MKSGNKRYDYLVRVLIEVRGGQRQWEKAERKLPEHGWEFYTPTPSERRLASRSLGHPRSSKFYWVEIGGFGCTWRSDKETHWEIRNFAKTEKVEVYARWTEKLDRSTHLLPEWQSYDSPFSLRRSTSSRSFSVAGFLHSLRRALAHGAVKVGACDRGNIVYGNKEEASELAKSFSSPEERPRVALRALDGRGRSGQWTVTEEAINRNVSLFTAPALLMGLFLVGVRETSALSSAAFGLFAVASASASACIAIREKLGRTHKESLIGASLLLVPVVVIFYGIPYASEGISAEQALILVVLFPLAMGVWFTFKQWRWQEQIASVIIPVIASVLIAVIPVTREVHTTAYADMLSLPTDSLKVNGLWRLASAVAVLFPLVATLLALTATWGILRYFHFLRSGSRLNIATLTIVSVATFIQVGTLLLDSPKEAAESLKRAAKSYEQPASYFGVTPEWSCVTPVVEGDSLNEQGGRLKKDEAYLFFGASNGKAVFWQSEKEKPLQIDESKIRVTPSKEPSMSCS